MGKSNGKKINTAVFISGRGSNLKSLIMHSKKKKFTDDYQISYFK